MRLRSVSDLFLTEDQALVPIFLVPESGYESFLGDCTPFAAQWLKAQGFKGQSGKMILLPATDGTLQSVVLGLGAAEDSLALAQCAKDLPEGGYKLAPHDLNWPPDQLALSWALGAYTFNQYKSASREPKPARLLWPRGAQHQRVLASAEAVWNARDWINTPASDMGPDRLEMAARAVAGVHAAKVEVITGDALIDQNYPLIHAVGRAAAIEPRLITFTWGNPSHRTLALVGKGVCFDTGGLDLKPSANMLTMRKDMGGAATVLGLAHMIMAAQWQVYLKVYVPAVENSVAGNAYRPGDIIRSRKGLTVEIGNTDAEGRLILADALTKADEDGAERIICMATLTGAARVATGFELPPFFCTDDGLAARLALAAKAQADPMWRLPLWPSYGALIEGKSADLTNSPESANAGAITAALFLARFVTPSRSFVHLDIAAWTDRAKPGRPVGAEANGIRTLFAALEDDYASR